MQDDLQPTRQKLIAVALEMFGRDGFQATSTRALAAAADTNISSIAYHFGGKDGLRLACADAVAARFDRIAQTLPAPDSFMTPAQARQTLRDFLCRITLFITSASEAEQMVAFMLRELGQPDSPVLDRLYLTLIEKRHRFVCQIWGLATGRDPDSIDTKLAVFSLVGQAAYFRLAAPIVQRRMGWDGYTPQAAKAIIRRLLVNLDAMMEAEHA